MANIYSSKTRLVSQTPSLLVLSQIAAMITNGKRTISPDAILRHNSATLSAYVISSGKNARTLAPRRHAMTNSKYVIKKKRSHMFEQTYEVEASTLC